MKVKTTDFSGFNTEAILKEHMPYSYANYSTCSEYKKTCQAWYEYFETNKHALPVYEITQQEKDSIIDRCNKFYSYCMDVLKNHVFQMDYNSLYNMFKMPGVSFEDFKNFVDYAKQSLQTYQGLSLYGRTDMYYNPITQEAGVYEFNADTPTMLFESVIVQDQVCIQANRPDDQVNNWWEEAVEYFKKSPTLQNRKVAVVCDPRFIEDFSTSEVIYWMFEAAGYEVYFETLETLQCDDHPLLPFHSVERVDRRYGIVFMLLPWEEMVASNPEVFARWRNWDNQVCFLEPAWRWFMSNKAFMAVAYKVFENSQQYNRVHGGLLIPTFTDQDNDLIDYVRKPTIGRFSSNITLIKDLVVHEKTEGIYGEGDFINQQYRPCGKTEKGANFIMCVWYFNGKACNIAFREFDDKILEVNNERYVPHMVK